MKLGALTLALSVTALALGVAALTQERAPPPRVPVRTDRVAALEAKVADLTRQLERLRSGRRDVEAGVPGLPSLPRPEDGDGSGRVPPPSRGSEELEAIVDDVVARKTERVIDEMRAKANKKPAMDVFATVLELTDEQRAQTERVIVEGQRKVHQILQTPTYDGTNLMDELVEIAAKGLAEPGQDHGFGRWLGRVLTEPIPGTDETYGTRIEAVKSSMRAAFQREWSDAQYREFEAWGVDPTEVEKVPGSPNEVVWKRIVERARVLGAELPEGAPAGGR